MSHEETGYADKTGYRPEARNDKAPHKCEASESWCPDAESTHGHADFQSAALPTELSGRGAH